MKNKAVVVFSGGQDSTTCLAQAIQTFSVENVFAVTINYGQRHAAEVHAARRIAAMVWGDGVIEHHETILVMDILRGTSPLVDKSSAVDQYAGVESLPDGLEKTFVPLRNTLFLTIAANRAVCLAGTDASIELITGVSQEDYGGYPDCRETFINALEAAFHESLHAPGLPTIMIATPLIRKSKCDTVIMSESTPGARALLAYSHTCYNGAVPPCGKCHACLLRAKGYDEAGVIDPLLERLAHEAA